jgi:hypothetical protein
MGFMRRLFGGGEQEPPQEIPDPLGWLAIDRVLDARYGGVEPRGNEIDRVG